MARIKTAFEIAMERVDDIDSDPEQIRKDSLKRQGKKIAGSFIFDPDKSINDVKQVYEAIPEADRTTVKTAIVDTILANLSLPQNEEYVKSLGRLKVLMTVLTDSDKELLDAFVQIDNLYTQYLETREQMKDHLIEQYTPQLKQKQQMLEEKTGQHFELKPEQDKEFVELLYQSYQRLDTQFGQVLDQLRDLLRTLA